MPDLDTDPAVSLCFSVKVDGKDLGAFISCEGLGVEVAVEEREEGGQNQFVHKLAGRLKYTNVKLTRPINGDTEKVAKWFAAMANGVTRTTAEIAALTCEGIRIATWSLDGVIPVRWTGPQLNVEQAKVATETLELAHHGFIEPAGTGG